MPSVKGTEFIAVPIPSTHALSTCHGAAHTGNDRGKLQTGEIGHSGWVDLNGILRLT